MKMAMMVILEEGKSLFQEIYQLVPFSFKFYIFLDIIFNGRRTGGGGVRCTLMVSQKVIKEQD